MWGGGKGAITTVSTLVSSKKMSLYFGDILLSTFCPLFLSVQKPAIVDYFPKSKPAQHIAQALGTIQYVLIL